MVGRIVSVYLKDFRHSACAVSVSISLHNEVNRVCHLGAHECVIEIRMRRQCEVGQTVQGERRRIGVYGGHGPAVSRIHRLQHVVRRVIAHFADDDSIWSMTECCRDQVSN